MYVNGYGIKQDFHKGVSLFLLAAKKGHKQAQMDLGVAYFTGKGIIPDTANAYAWFHVAAKQGVKNAYKNKSLIYDKMLDEDKQRAVKLASEYAEKYIVKQQ